MLFRFVIFIVLSVSLALELANGNLATFPELNDFSFEKSLLLFFNYAIKIKTISKYSQKQQALAKFMEIHDDLLNHLIFKKNDLAQLGI